MIFYVNGATGGRQRCREMGNLNRRFPQDSVLIEVSAETARYSIVAIADIRKAIIEFLKVVL